MVNGHYKKIPIVEGKGLLGSFTEFKKAPHEFLANSSISGHGLFQFRMLNRNFVGIVGADCAETIFKQNSQNYPRGNLRKPMQALLGLGLVNLEGDDWKNHRRMVAQAFKPDFLRYTLNQNSKLVSKMLDEWAQKASANESVEVVDEMRRFTLSVIIMALFSTELDMDNDRQVCDAVANANDLVFKKYTAFLKTPIWFPSPLNRQLASARQAMNRYSEKYLNAKQASPDRQTGDMGDHFLALYNQGEMSLEEIYDEIRTLLVAGFETSSTALAWTLYLIAKNPRVIQRWQQELSEQLGSAPPTWENIGKLKYTEHLFMESLRLYPPLYMLTRVCLKDDVVQDYVVPAGSGMMLSIYAIQRSPAYWDNPDQFIPERFETDWPEHAFLPFGIGKHICIGSRFAMLESILILACIGQRFNISLAQDTEVKPDPKVALVPDREIRLHLEPRL